MLPQLYSKILRSILLLLTFFILQNSFAQKAEKQIKPFTLGVQVFYNDFKTPQLIKTSSLSTVLNTGTWANPKNMEGGFGITTMKGIKPKIDLVAALNLSWVNYQLPNSFTLFGSTHTMLDFNVGGHLKLFTDKRSINPFIITKLGYEKYKTYSGFNAQPGVGIQISFLNEFFLIPTFQYKLPFGTNTSAQFLYGINISAPLKKSKKAPLVKKNVEKDITITVNDEATGLPLPNATVFITKAYGTKQEAVTNEEGIIIFSKIKSGDYTITATLNNISASTANVTEQDFSNKNVPLTYTLLHNDPRFTLVGNVVDKSANNNPVGGTTVSATNIQTNAANTSVSNATLGEFSIQLESNSDFTVVGKKANYISNIETVSTKGLNRSATLYVKLKLGIENAEGKSIILNNISFATGSATLNTTTSTDLNKLAQFLKDNDAAKLEIQGHTDDVGNLQSNITLSEQRANAVVNYLVANGIDKNRLTAKGYGPANPIASNKTASGKAKNRRVEMKLLP